MKRTILRVEVKPELLRWARNRAGLSKDALTTKFPKYAEWEIGEAKPTLKQLEKLAKTVHAPFGYFFLSKPPDEPFPIPDFRTVGIVPLLKPSVDLLDTVYRCQRRQAWYRDHLSMEGKDHISFVGSTSTAAEIEPTAERIRGVLKFDLEERQNLPSWTEALRQFIRMADEIGVLIIVSGIVANNTTRKLDPEEFRGLALADNITPLIFINGADTKAAQMFTLAHELAHLWIGKSALSNSRPDMVPEHAVEFWCNRVAAEILVPLATLYEYYQPGEDLSELLIHLARRFKVSTLVVLRRIYDAGGLTQEQFQKAYVNELQRLRSVAKSDGGNFHPIKTTRIGKNFARSVIVSTLEGKTSFTEAFELLGIRKIRTFDELASRLGVVA